ncbi:YciI family protein [Streptomyces sp. RFCAC02]|uniref:YciI family protein n=1 Tax=Streptomyces sp. RFCAC02 TaxID=2499143 RepID=UPI00101ECFDC|nr:YciI family protein [Streptomyces sp. RFCAC02]
MLHLLRLRYTGTEDDAAPHVAGHVAYLERHHAAGTFLVSGQAVPTSEGGAIIAHGVDRDAIERIVADDPFVTSGVARYTVTTVAPGRIHPVITDALARITVE